MKFRPLLVLLLTVPCLLSAQVDSVAKDGFPAGQGTPEGAAADFARAFIQKDDALFQALCVPPYGGDGVQAKYQAFKDQVKEGMSEESARKTPSPGGPKEIGKVFTARHLSLGGPASYGYAAFGFDDVEFVDVGVILVNGDKGLNRTLMIKDHGKWYVHPDPELSPLLSAGLNQESPSTK